MKPLIVAGVPRSGKTTLAKRVCRATGRSHLPADALVSMLERRCPELGVCHAWDEHDAVCGAFEPFLDELLRHYRYEGVDLVLDVTHVSPAWIAGKTGRGEAVVLGYPGVDVSAKAAAVRGVQRSGDWTERLSDRELADLVERFADRSRRLERECAEAEVPFVDAGRDFEAAMREAEVLLSPSCPDGAGERTS